MVRLWCRTHADGPDFATDYQPWVVESFSGILCVDEVHQGKLALLLAVDPAVPDGDRLVGYELVEGTVDQGAMGAFLRRLAAIGISPAQVITDGSARYPRLLAEVWPTSASPAPSSSRGTASGGTRPAVDQHRPRRRRATNAGGPIPRSPV